MNILHGIRAVAAAVGIIGIVAAIFTCDDHPRVAWGCAAGSAIGWLVVAFIVGASA